MYKTSCGYNKWSIGIDENKQVIIDYGHECIYGNIQLNDIDLEEIKKLGDMFYAAYHHFNQLNQQNQQNRKTA